MTRRAGAIATVYDGPLIPDSWAVLAPLVARLRQITGLAAELPRARGARVDALSAAVEARRDDLVLAVEHRPAPAKVEAWWADHARPEGLAEVAVWLTVDVARRLATGEGWVSTAITAVVAWAEAVPGAL